MQESPYFALQINEKYLGSQLILLELVISEDNQLFNQLLLLLTTDLLNGSENAETGIIDSRIDDGKRRISLDFLLIYYSEENLDQNKLPEFCTDVSPTSFF